MKEVRWGAGKRYYVTQEINADLDPYFLVVSDWSFYVTDGDKIYYIDREDAGKGCRVVPTMPLYLRRFHEGAWKWLPGIGKSRQKLSVVGEPYRFGRPIRMRRTDFNAVKRAIRKFCKNG